MPFARSWRRSLTPTCATSRRGMWRPETISEILRELSRVIPDGFVERRMPSWSEIEARTLFMDLADVEGDRAGREERRAFQELLEDLSSGRPPAA